MGHTSSRPLVYHDGMSASDRIEVLCRAMRDALCCYNDLVGDIRKGGVDDEFDDFTDFDEYGLFSVSEVATPFGRAEHQVPADFTGLVVCYLYSAIAQVPTLDDGADLICAASGRLVTLIEEDGYNERHWLPHPLDGPPAVPHEPAPQPCRTPHA